ncbi:MAG TPA: lipoprotein [Sphingomicrobium sp.]
MRKSLFLLGGVAALAACSSSDDDAANQAAAKAAAAAKKPKPAYCFFKDSETKGWAAERGKDGNVIVTGKAYREDSRYKAVLNPATIAGTSADIAPTIIQNDGYAAPENWWDMKATIPNSAAITNVNVRCGAKTVATLTLPPKA